MKRVFIVAGGTGGHVYPAIVLAQELQRNLQMKIFFAGTKKGIGKEIFEREKFEYELFDLEGLDRSFSLKFFRSLWKLSKSFFKAFSLLKKFKPDVVIGMGGYISPPIILAAVLNNIPTVIHEQNVIPGLSNRFLSMIVDQTTIAFPQTLRYFKKAIVSGNPVRSAIESTLKDTGRRNLGLDLAIPTVFIFGGSQGSHRLNEIFKETLTMLKERNINLQFIWMTGEKDWEGIDEFCRNLNFRSIVRPFFFNIEDAYVASDLIISRAGALSISEIAACGRPAILIPYPSATANHQYYNAKILEEKGGSIIIEEKDLTKDKLGKLIFDLLSNKARLTMMGDRNKELYRPDAPKVLLLSILSVMKK